MKRERGGDRVGAEKVLQLDMPGSVAVAAAGEGE